MSARNGVISQECRSDKPNRVPRAIAPHPTSGPAESVSSTPRKPGAGNTTSPFCNSCPSVLLDIQRQPPAARQRAMKNASKVRAQYVRITPRATARVEARVAVPDSFSRVSSARAVRRALTASRTKIPLQGRAVSSIHGNVSMGSILLFVGASVALRWASSGASSVFLDPCG